MWTLIRIIKTAINEFVSDGCMSSGAAIAYYSIFAMPPLVMLVYISLGYAGFSNDEINQSVKRRLGLPSAAAELSSVGMSAAGDSAATDPQSNSSASEATLSGFDSLGGMFSLAVLIFTATGLFGELQVALNRAWSVMPDPNQGGLKRFLMKRIFSLGIIFSLALLLLLSMLLSTLLDAIYGHLQGWLPDLLNRNATIVFDNAVTLIVATLLFALVFKVLPDADMRWRDLWVGAFFTAILFVIGKALVAWYLQRASVGSSWGNATTSLIALLAWLYYTSLIVLLGAEFTQVWAREVGDGFRPTSGARNAAQATNDPAHKKPLGRVSAGV